ncbi:MAG TPA: hypothetical protein VGC07_03800 [Granulicella sp.]
MGRPKLIKVDVSDARGRGGVKDKTVTVQTRIPDILAYRDTPIFAYLLLAANPETPVPVLQSVLEAVGPHQERSPSWLYKRKALLSVPAIPPDADPRAVEVIRANMNLSPRKLRAMLRKLRIKCSVDKMYRIWMAISYLTAMDSCD